MGISRVLSKPSTISAIYLLDYALPQVATLRRAVQEEKIDLTALVPLVDATLHTLENAILPVANWVMELLDTNDDLEAATEIEISTESNSSCQNRVAKSFITMLTKHIPYFLE